MTQDEMKAIILELVTKGDHISFVELQDAIGEAARGDAAIEFPAGSNMLLWVGVSKEFSNALLELRPEIVPVPCHLLIYLADGACPRLPIVKGRIPKGGFKKEHWCPVVWRLRSRAPAAKVSPATKRRLDEDLRAMQAKADQEPD